MEHPKCLPAIPDISGIGVRAAIYAQNLLCFFPVGVYLWDKKISREELSGVKDQSVGMLAIAFSILITTIILAGSEGPTISSYHAAIVLDLSWMNNTSTWIWFILFVHHKSGTQHKPTAATWSAWWELLWSPDVLGKRGTGSGSAIQRSFLRLSGFAQRLFLLVTAAPVLTLGSIHLSLMAAIGIWLWANPAKFGNPIHCNQEPKLAVFGASVNFSSTPLRVFSLTMYSVLLIPGFNLLAPFLFFLALHVSYNWSRKRHTWFWDPCVRAYTRVSGALFRNPSDEEDPNPSGNSSPTPANSVHTAFLVVGLACLVAINILFIVDIELTLHRNKEIQIDEESQWGFGQILALLLLVMPLRDAWNALRDIRNRFQQQFEQLFQTAAEAKPLEETITDLSKLVDDGANPRKPTLGRFGNFLQMAAYYGKRELVNFLLLRGAPMEAAGGDYGTALQVASVRGHDEIVEVLLDHGADANVKGDPRDYATVLRIASANNLVSLVETLLESDLDANVDGRDYGTILQAASARGHDRVVELLLNKGADVNVQGGDYGTALCASVANGRIGIATRLLKQKVHLKATGPFGVALHVAVVMEDEEMVTLLLGENSEEADCEFGSIGNAVDRAGLIKNKILFDLLLRKGLKGSVSYYARYHSSADDDRAAYADYHDSDSAASSYYARHQAFAAMRDELHRLVERDKKRKEVYNG